MSEVIATLREMEELGCLLWNDAKNLEKNVNSDSMRRHFVRAVFAYIEGLVFQLKQLSLTRHESGSCSFLQEDLALLREESYELDEKGLPILRKAYIQLPRNLRFTFAAYAKAFGIEYVVKVDSTGWQAFREAINVRHRLMHPKSVGDLEVSREETTQAKTVLDWFTDEYCNLLRSCSPKFPATYRKESDSTDRFKRGSKAKARSIAKYPDGP